MSKIILASSSIYRKELLGRLIPKFDHVSPNIDESIMKKESARDASLRLAFKKASLISEDNINAYVIGSDQTAEFNQIHVRKPKTHEEALEQLLLLSEKVVNFYSAVCVFHKSLSIKKDFIETIEVKYRKITKIEAETYLKYEKPIGCLGCIKSEGLGISLLEYVKSSDPTAIIGMPLIGLSKIFSSLDIKFHASE